MTEAEANERLEKSPLKVFQNKHDHNAHLGAKADEKPDKEKCETISKDATML